MTFDLENLGDVLTYMVKFASWFPYKSGKLRDHATSGMMHTADTYRIHFSSTVAPYVEYLEEGTKPHDIPNAFGYGPTFGIGGRFDGKFHPGSMKHRGFISNKAVNAIVDYISTRYQGEVTVG